MSWRDRIVKILMPEQPEILNVRLVLNKEEEAHDSDGSNNESNSSESDSE
jgi:hypothetical protein